MKKYLLFIVCLLFSSSCFAFSETAKQNCDKALNAYFTVGTDASIDLLTECVKNKDSTILDTLHYLVFRALILKEGGHDVAFEGEYLFIKLLIQTNADCMEEYRKCYQNEDFDLFVILSDKDIRNFSFSEYLRELIVTQK